MAPPSLGRGRTGAFGAQVDLAMEIAEVKRERSSTTTSCFYDSSCVVPMPFAPAQGRGRFTSSGLGEYHTCVCVGGGAENGRHYFTDSPDQQEEGIPGRCSGEKIWSSERSSAGLF